ncbi:3'-5' exonuclease [Nesterenkonia sphaerica]|uniref:3'-5' exonuclease n=1 Tax=Nesterenkonia sphaerica TaxID=1804988 RepID=UPI001AA04E60|nr:3'-5' exonuclease [Nesterenkonia sphaerica]
MNSHIPGEQNPGHVIASIQKRIKIGNENTLLTSAGVHLLTGHVGKGQQFDWVWIVGAEQDTIPFFKATSPEEKAEEARVLSVMMSRARHGVVVTYTDAVPTLNGNVRTTAPSEFLSRFQRLDTLDMDGIKEWFAEADWNALAKR